MSTEIETALMSPLQREMARHALGLPNPQRESYRNHYCIEPGGAEYDAWMDLVERNLAVRRKNPGWLSGDMFYLTLAGALDAREGQEHLGREDAENMRKYSDASPILRTGSADETKKENSANV